MLRFAHASDVQGVLSCWHDPTFPVTKSPGVLFYYYCPVEGKKLPVIIAVSIAYIAAIGAITITIDASPHPLAQIMGSLRTLLALCGSNLRF